MEFRLGGSRLSKSMSEYGTDSENSSGDRIRSILQQIGVTGTVDVGGGSGHGKDIKVNVGAQEIIFENKRTGGSRIDYKQFRMKISDGGVVQHTMNDNSTISGIFDSKVKDTLDKILRVSDSNYPIGPKLTESQGWDFWNEFGGDYSPSSGGKPSGDVYRCSISPDELQEVLRVAGNDYIIIGQQVFALFSGAVIDEFRDYIVDPYVLFRLKYHKADDISYTLTFRASSIKDSGQDFDEQIIKIIESL